jgi:hypothetical protein
VTAERFKDEAPAVARKFAADEKVKVRVARLFADKAPASLADVAQRYARLFGRVEKAWRELQA